MEMSFAFGLFAIFTIMRSRTSSISIKDMAYIFAVVGMSMMNALKVLKFPVLGIIIFNIIILLSAYLLEEYHLSSIIPIHILLHMKISIFSGRRRNRNFTGSLLH